MRKTRAQPQPPKSSTQTSSQDGSSIYHCSSCEIPLPHAFDNPGLSSRNARRTPEISSHLLPEQLDMLVLATRAIYLSLGYPSSWNGVCRTSIDLLSETSNNQTNKQTMKQQVPFVATKVPSTRTSSFGATHIPTFAATHPPHKTIACPVLSSPPLSHSNGRVNACLAWPSLA
jgi:hypothetical protein